MAPPIKPPPVKNFPQISVSALDKSHQAEIPKEWKDKVIHHLETPLFCAAFSVVMSQSDKMTFWDDLSDEAIGRAFESATNAVQRARPAIEEDKLGEEKLGRLLYHFDDSTPSVILLHPKLFSEKGSKPFHLIPSQATRDVVMLHEALHEVMVALQKGRKFASPKLSPKTQEGLILEILKLYFNEKGFSKVVNSLLADGGIEMLKTACKSSGGYDSGSVKGPFGGLQNMAPPLETIKIRPDDINRDGTRDSVAEGTMSVGGVLPDGSSYIDLVEIGHVPLLRNPDPEKPHYSFDSFQDCSVDGSGANIIPWVIRKPGRIEKILNPWVRFNNVQDNMSFISGERVILQEIESPRIILGIIVLVNESDDTFVNKVYAQFENCNLVPLDQLALAMSDGDRLDMNRVAQLLEGGADSETTDSEIRVASEMKEIQHKFAKEMARVRALPTEDRADELYVLRQNIFRDIQKMSKTIAGLPKGWANGAMTLLGFPSVSLPYVAQKDE